MAHRDIFISDLHLGNGKGQEDSDSKALDRFAEEVLEPRDDLWVVGDLFELLQCHADDILTAHMDWLRKVCQKVNVNILCGNHDSIELLRDTFLSKFLILHRVAFISPLETHFVIHRGDRYILILHGHQYDAQISKHPMLARFVAKLGGYGENVWPNIDTLLTKFEAWLEETGRHSRNEHYYPYLSALSRSIEPSHLCDAVIFGHTHKGEAKTYEGVNIINIGSWVTASTGERKHHFAILDRGDLTLQEM